MEESKVVASLEKLTEEIASLRSDISENRKKHAKDNQQYQETRLKYEEDMVQYREATRKRNEENNEWKNEIPKGTKIIAVMLALLTAAIVFSALMK